MANSYICCYMHCIFSTKSRQNLIAPELQKRLWPYMGGIARENDMSALAVGGTENHIHILLSIPSTLSVAKSMQLIKGGTSKWIHETFPSPQNFAWQEGYGAFSVSKSLIEKTIAYINNQQEHHRTLSFEKEYIGFLEKFGIAYDKNYVFG